MIDYTQYGTTLYDFDYMNALLWQMRAESGFKPRFGAYQTVKLQYGLSGSRDNVMIKFETLIDEVYENGKS